MPTTMTERLALNSARWNESRMLLKRGRCAAEILQRIANENAEAKIQLIHELVAGADDGEVMYAAFYYACPYLIDCFEPDLVALWPAFTEFCDRMMTALDGPTEHYASQIYSDRERIGKLLLKALEYHTKLEAKGKSKYLDFELLVGCFASLFGDGCLGIKIRSGRFDG